MLWISFHWFSLSFQFQKGIIRTAEEDYIIEPVEHHRLRDRRQFGNPHRLYKRSTLGLKQNQFCGAKPKCMFTDSTNDPCRPIACVYVTTVFPLHGFNKWTPFWPFLWVYEWTHFAHCWVYKWTPFCPLKGFTSEHILPIAWSTRKPLSAQCWGIQVHPCLPIAGCLQVSLWLPIVRVYMYISLPSIYYSSLNSPLFV